MKIFYSHSHFDPWLASDCSFPWSKAIIEEIELGIRLLVIFAGQYVLCYSSKLRHKLCLHKKLNKIILQLGLCLIPLFHSIKNHLILNRGSMSFVWFNQCFTLVLGFCWLLIAASVDQRVPGLLFVHLII